MVMVELKGLHVVKAGGKSYVYAWRGGPRIKAKLGTPEFMAEYNAAIESERIPDQTRFRAQIAFYKGSTDFTGLAPTTRKVWARWLDLVAAHFGNLATAQFGRTDKIKPVIRKWLATFADRPRSYDYAKQVLSRVLSYCVDQGEIATNPCEGIKSVYDADRSEIIWTDDDIAQFRTGASAEVILAVELAAQCGLRSADIFRLAWSHIGDDAIVIKTSKSRFKKEAIIPIHDELRAVLDRIPRRSTIVLTNSEGRPWRGFSSSFSTAMDRAGMADRDLHFHDLRGTAATKFYLAGIAVRTIAEIMAWEEGEVEKIIRRYVSRNAAVQDTILKMRAKSVPTVPDDRYEIDGRAEVQSRAALAAGNGVYFVRGKTSSRVKIGSARNAIGRLMELSIGSSETLVLQAVVKGGRAEEAYLHHYFRGDRVKGEWFEPTDLLDALVAAIAEADDLDWKTWLAERETSAKVIPLER